MSDLSSKMAARVKTEPAKRAAEAFRSPPTTCSVPPSICLVPRCVG